MDVLLRGKGHFCGALMVVSVFDTRLVATRVFSLSDKSIGGIAYRYGVLIWP